MYNHLDQKTSKNRNNGSWFLYYMAVELAIPVPKDTIRILNTYITTHSQPDDHSSPTTHVGNGSLDKYRLRDDFQHCWLNR